MWYADQDKRPMLLALAGTVIGLIILSVLWNCLAARVCSFVASRIGRNCLSKPEQICDITYKMELYYL